MTAPLDLARLLSLSLTAAPWGVQGGHRIVAVDADGNARGGMRVGMAPHVGTAYRGEDAELFAAAPALLAEVEHLRECLLRVVRMYEDCVGDEEPYPDDLVEAAKAIGYELSVSEGGDE